MTKWSSSVKGEDWDVLKLVGKGGQGVVARVCHKTSGLEGCLKRLSDQKSPERRARFFREATAYDTCHHEAIPRLLESNAHQHSDHSYKLFIVTEFVSGTTLSERIESDGLLSFADASSMMIRLLDIMVYLHGQGWVHRDIKPDNIIIRDNDLSNPVLLDFGLSFKDGITESFQTEVGQELGNRFLRLPELAVGSDTKQDVRSDIAFAGGILFYALTGIFPAVLQDSDGRMPHQRPVATGAMAKLSDHNAMALRGFFDRCFSFNPQGRFASANETLTAMTNIIVASSRQPGDQDDDDIDFIVNHINRPANQLQIIEFQKLEVAQKEIQAVYAEVAKHFTSMFVQYSNGFAHVPQGVRYSMGFALFNDHNTRFTPVFLIEVIGSEIVIRADDVTVHRTGVAAPAYGDNFKKSIRRIFVDGVRALIYGGHS